MAPLIAAGRHKQLLKVGDDRALDLQVRVSRGRPPAGLLWSRRARELPDIDRPAKELPESPTRAMRPLMIGSG